MRDGDLFAAPFDLDALEITGSAVEIVRGLATSTRGTTADFKYAVSPGGDVTHLTGVGNESLVLAWVKDWTEGRPQQVARSALAYQSVRARQFGDCPSAARVADASGTENNGAARFPPDHETPRAVEKLMFSDRRRNLVCATGVAAIILTIAAGAGVAAGTPQERAAAGRQQGPPPAPQNLQVLPSGMSRQAVVGVMRGIATSLGVQCIHCHVGEDPNDLRSTDFVSDARETKRIARVMMRMVQSINESNAANLAEFGREEPLEVTCATCHHGQARPVPIQDLLVGAYDEGGVEAAVAEYRTLRERYYGQWTYDFSPGMLRMLADGLARRGDGPVAIALLDLQDEYFPDDVGNLLTRAQVHGILGDDDAAREAFRACSDADPDGSVGDFCRRNLARLSGEQ